MLIFKGNKIDCMPSRKNAGPVQSNRILENWSTLQLSMYNTRFIIKKAVKPINQHAYLLMRRISATVFMRTGKVSIDVNHR